MFTSHLTVLPEWIDHNGHMNVAYYVLAFDEATDGVYETWGMGLHYPEKTEFSVFTLGMNVDYLGELFVHDPIRVATQLLDYDHKRVHYFHHMYHAETGALMATNECLAMNVSLATRKSASFPELVQIRLAATLAEDEVLEMPALFQRKLEIRRK
jgi:acyl-CoA thioester hydrolase